MHYFKYILVTFSVLFLSCSSQDGYKIKGESQEIIYNTDNSTVFLYEIQDDNTLCKIDSTAMYSISKFSMVRNSEYPISPKTGLILVDNKEEQDYNIMYLEQGYIHAIISKKNFSVYNTDLNDKKYALDQAYLAKNKHLQDSISQYLELSNRTTDSALLLKKYNKIKIMEYYLFDQILDSINHQDNLLSKGNTLINYYRIKSIKENGNNVFGVELFLDEERKFKGYELDFAIAALSDSIKQNDPRVKEYLSSKLTPETPL